VCVWIQRHLFYTPSTASILSIPAFAKGIRGDVNAFTIMKRLDPPPNAAASANVAIR
jgi:hypothetical protein